MLVSVLDKYASWILCIVTPFGLDAFAEFDTPVAIVPGVKENENY